MLGCVAQTQQATPASTVQTNQASITINPANTQEAATQQNQPGTFPAFTQQQILQADQALYADAIRSNDASLCAKIQSSDFQKQCITAVNEGKILNEALSKHDKSLCQQLSTDVMKKNCETLVTALSNEQLKTSQTQITQQ